MNYIDRIEALGACTPALEWLRDAHHPTLEAAWIACTDHDWLVWLHTHAPSAWPASEYRALAEAAARALQPDVDLTDEEVVRGKYRANGRTARDLCALIACQARTCSDKDLDFYVAEAVLYYVSAQGGSGVHRADLVRRLLPCPSLE